MTEQSKHILVADDCPVVARIVRSSLERAGFRVTVARNGREAMQYALQHHFDLVVTDQQMPEMTGTEWSRRFCEQTDRGVTPFIFLTAKGFELDLAQLRDRLNIAAIVAKPFSPKELVSTVKACVGAELR